MVHAEAGELPASRFPTALAVSAALIVILTILFILRQGGSSDEPGIIMKPTGKVEVDSGAGWDRATIGQEPDAELCSFLHDKTPMDARRLKTFLDTFSDCTAVVSTTSPLAQKLVEVCDMLEIRIPEDLSIVSLQVAVLRPSSGADTPAFTGVVYLDSNILPTFATVVAVFNINIEIRVKSIASRPSDTNRPIQGFPTIWE